MDKFTDTSPEKFKIDGGTGGDEWGEVRGVFPGIKTLTYYTIDSCCIS